MNFVGPKAYLTLYFFSLSLLSLKLTILDDGNHEWNKKPQREEIGREAFTLGYWDFYVTQFTAKDFR